MLLRSPCKLLHLRGQESENSQEALRVLDIILRQHAARQGCLLVRQSFFHNDPKNFTDLGGGVLGCRGLHSSFRTTQGGLSLNIAMDKNVKLNRNKVHRACAEREILEMLDHPFLPTLYASFQMKGMIVAMVGDGINDSPARLRQMLAWQLVRGLMWLLKLLI